MAFSKLGNFNFHFAALPDLMWAFVFFFFLVCTRLPAQPPFAFFWFKMRRWPAFHHILIVWTGPQTEPPPLPWWVSGEADVMGFFFVGTAAAQSGCLAFVPLCWWRRWLHVCVSEASKLVMSYVAAVCGKGQEVNKVKEQLLQSNPVLEGEFTLGELVG